MSFKFLLLSVLSLTLSLNNANTMESEDLKNSFQSSLQAIKDNTYNKKEFKFEFDPFYDGYEENDQSLKLTDQQIITLSEALKNNSSIDTISLSGNNITDVGSMALAKLDHIKNLDLSYNPITIVGGVEIAKNKLESLNLEGTSLYQSEENKNQFLEFVHNINKNNTLKTLELIYCELSDEAIDALLKNNKSIEYLSLGRGMTDDAFKSFKDNTILKSLDIGTNEITDVGAEYIAQNKSLEFLRMDMSKITNIGLKFLSSHSTLKELILTDSDITEEGLNCLFESKLKKISLLTSQKKRIISFEKRPNLENSFIKLGIEFSII